jgi:hypothetical protein
MFTWIKGPENLTRLTVKAKDKMFTPSNKASSSSLTATTSNAVKASISSPYSTQQKCRQEFCQESTLQRSSTGTWANEKQKPRHFNL